MVVEVIIRKKEISGKDFNLLELIYDGMRYGSYDDFFRLKEDDINGPVVIFDSKIVCRGHEISFNDESIFLSLSLPTNENDIQFFYHHIKIICKMMDTDEFIRNDEKVTLDLINNCIEIDKTSSINALKDMKAKISNGTYENMYIFGAINPVVFGIKQIEFIDCDIQKFGNFMNELQNIDAYYAKPGIYKQPDSTVFGVYILSINITSIFPQNPQPIFISQKIPNFYVSFAGDNNLKGLISYNDFLNNVDKTNEYDAEHFIITLNKSEINELLEKFKTNI